MKNRALAAIRTILLTELDNVTGALRTYATEETLAPDDLDHWSDRLGLVNSALQFIEKLDGLRVVHMTEDQYQVMRTLLEFHQGNDDFGPFEEDPSQWPYNPNTLDELVTRLNNLEKHGL